MQSSATIAGCILCGEQWEWAQLAKGNKMFRYLLALNQIKRAVLKFSVSGEGFTELVTGLNELPDGIVVDPARENIYWTNMGVPTLTDSGESPTEENLDFYGKNGSIEWAAIDGGGRSYLLPPGSFVTGKQLSAAWSLGRLYWSDREGAAIRSVQLDGSGLRDEVVVAAAEQDRHTVRNQCVGLTVDERNGFLYWTQKGPSKGGDGRIFRTSLEIPDGQTPENRDIEVLWAGLPEPIDIELDLDGGVIYWTDRGAPPLGNTLNRAQIPAQRQSGGDVTVLASGFGEAIGLAVDKEAGIAYVSDMAGEIRAVNLDGSGERTLAKVDGNFTGIVGI